MKTALLFLAIPVWLSVACTTTANPGTGEEYSDTWLEAKIVTAYALNDHLNPFRIDVDVEDRSVTLTGEVESGSERDLAELIAEGVEGVREVDNQIVVEPEAQRDAERGSFKRTVDDANITAKVKSKLLLNPHTQGLKINVTTKNGVVILDGEVGSEIEADLARQIALNTEGVVDVENRLSVNEE